MVSLHKKKSAPQTPQEEVTSADKDDNPQTMSTTATTTKLSPNRLSQLSRMYDIDGDGKLNEAEQAMRDLDTAGVGHISNDKVYRIMEQQMALQHQMFNMKRIVIGLVAFSVILALSNLGTAFAAASLAKDTSVSEPTTAASGVSPTLQDKAGHDLATLGKGLSIDAQTIQLSADQAPTDGRRALLRASGRSMVAVPAINRACGAGQTYQPLFGCYPNPRTEAMPCLVAGTNGMCAEGLKCERVGSFTAATPNTGECVSADGGSYGGYNIKVVEKTPATPSATAGDETAVVSEPASTNPQASTPPATTGTDGAVPGTATTSTTDESAPVPGTSSGEAAVPGTTTTTVTVTSPDLSVPGLPTTDDSAIVLVHAELAQRAYFACRDSIRTTVQHLCFGNPSVSTLGCTNFGRRPSGTGPTYYFDNDVVIDCSEGEHNCRTIGLRCTDFNRGVDDGLNPVSTPATPAASTPDTPPAPVPCTAPATQGNLELNNPTSSSVCARSCECLSGCCIERPFPNPNVCVPQGVYSTVQCMSI
mmetsp:Transcript_17405/g.38012  ORF Transcript_17405/g.38012 Transcript_17405/m.38012 type:complete len:533 (+) Transcript_17405:210-1808(+)